MTKLSHQLGGLVALHDRIAKQEMQLAAQANQLAAAEKELNKSRSEADSMRKRLSGLEQQLAATENERDESRRLVTALGKEIEYVRRYGLRREIRLSIDNVPSQYDEKAVLRIALSALRGGILTDIISVRHEPAPAAQTRVVVLIVNSTAVDLMVADQRVDCQAAICTLNVALRRWYVDGRAGDRDEPRFVAGTRLRGEKIDGFLSRLGVQDVYLPRITDSGQAVIYLPNDSYFQIYLKGAFGERAPSVDIRDGGYNLLRLEGTAPHWSIRLGHNPPPAADE